MFDLSFNAYINRRETTLQKRNYQFVSEITVLKLFGEYVSWLANFASDQLHETKFTASEMLIQLKIINAYHHHLIEKHKSNKSLVKPIVLPPIPKRLNKDNQPNPIFILPTTAHLPSGFLEKMKKNIHQKHAWALGMLCMFSISLCALGAFMLSKPIDIFLRFSIFLPMTVVCVFVILCTLGGLINYAINKEVPLEKPEEDSKHPLYFSNSVALITFGIGFACATAGQFLPLGVLACQLLIVIGSALSLFATFSFAANFVTPFFTYQVKQSTEMILKEMQTVANEQIVRDHASPLLQHFKRHDHTLNMALTATTHTLISSRAARALIESPSKNNDEEIEITHLKSEVDAALRIYA